VQNRISVSLGSRSSVYAAQASHSRLQTGCRTQCAFIELDQEIEKDTGMPLAEIFSLYGQSGYRAIESAR